MGTMFIIVLVIISVQSKYKYTHYMCYMRVSCIAEICMLVSIHDIGMFICYAS